MLNGMLEPAGSICTSLFDSGVLSLPVVYMLVPTGKVAKELPVGELVSGAAFDARTRAACECAGIVAEFMVTVSIPPVYPSTKVLSPLPVPCVPTFLKS